MSTLSASIDQYSVDQAALVKRQKPDSGELYVPMKKSILVTNRDSDKKGSSKTTIHWQEDPRKSRGEWGWEEQKHSTESGQRIVLNRGIKLRNIHEVLNRLKAEGEANAIELEEYDTLDPKSMDFLAREMGARKLRLENVRLNAQQEANLRLKKQKLRRDNELYLSKHPELDIMLVLIYRMLFKIKPGGPGKYSGPLDFLKPKSNWSDPKMYVANYVHHLNLHREELVLSEVDVPFDLPAASRAKDEEKWRITQFARVLVEKCAVDASQGEAYVNAGGILQSMLKDVSPSVESIGSAREAVEDILTSVLDSIDDVKQLGTRRIVDDIVNAIMTQLRPPLRKSSSLDIRNSVERSVGSFMHTLIGRVGKQIRMKDEHFVPSTILKRDSEDILDEFVALLPSKSILRRKQPSSEESVEIAQKDKKKVSRVKFGSVDEL